MKPISSPRPSLRKTWLPRIKPDGLRERQCPVVRDRVGDYTGTVRARTNAEKIQRLMELLARHASGPGRIYLTGGATAVLLGWRDTTLDVDLKLDPEPAGIFEALGQAKEDLDLNIELAAPDDFIPPLPRWQERSRYIASHGKLEFHHYDFYGQALSKIERGHTQDLEDVRSMFGNGLINIEMLGEMFHALVPALNRYPALDADAFSAKVEQAIREAKDRGKD